MTAVTKWFLILYFIMAWPFAHADTLRVAVASNFADTLRALAGTFEQQTGHTLQVLPGSTGKHYAQIRNGAPFDIFLAADVRRTALPLTGALPGTYLKHVVSGYHYRRK